MEDKNNDWIYRKKIVKEFKIKKEALKNLDGFVKDGALTYKTYYETLSNVKRVGDKLKTQVAGQLFSALGAALSDMADLLENKDKEVANGGSDNK